jgi:hypothetical protein
MVKPDASIINVIGLSSSPSLFSSPSSKPRFSTDDGLIYL